MHRTITKHLFLLILALIMVTCTVPVSADQNNGWFQYKGSYYYMESGVPAKGWKKVGNNYYYLNPSTCALQTGWVKSGSNYYYLDPSTGALKTGWVQSGKNYYYLDPTTAALQTGWVKSGGKYYYLDPSTAALKTGWVKDGGNWYYLSPTNGTVQTGVQKIDGEVYNFDANGKCLGKVQEGNSGNTVVPGGTSGNYVANLNTMKFHYPSCDSVNDMKEENKWYYQGTREELISLGYVPCKRCNP